MAGRWNGPPFGQSFIVGKRHTFTGVYMNRFMARYRLFRSCGFSWLSAVFGCASLDRRMARLWFPFVFVVVFVSGCNGSPTQPTRTERVKPETSDVVVRHITIPEWHNMPVVMPDGSIIRVCATMPREYVASNGTSVVQRDAYGLTGSDTCPAIPID